MSLIVRLIVPVVFNITTPFIPMLKTNKLSNLALKVIGTGNNEVGRGGSSLELILFSRIGLIKS